MDLTSGTPNTRLESALEIVSATSALPVRPIDAMYRAVASTNSGSTSRGIRWVTPTGLTTESQAMPPLVQSSAVIVKSSVSNTRAAIQKLGWDRQFDGDLD